MKREVTTAVIYDEDRKGLRMPIGSTSEGRSFSSYDIESTKVEAQAMLELFNEHGLNPSRSLSLSTLVSKTANCAVGMGINQSSYEDLFAALQLRRVLDAVSTIKNEPSLPRLLSELLDGSLDLLARTQSKAKDTLWEIELLQSLRTNGIAATIGEPDLLLAVSAEPISIACKKLYSTANFSKVLSRAVQQIERSNNLGIVAINIDDLVPENSILKSARADIATKILNKKIELFMVEQERYLRKYIEPGRAIAVIVSCAALADLEENTPRFCNIRQSVAWHIPSISPKIDGQFTSILSAFEAGEEGKAV